MNRFKLTAFSATTVVMLGVVLASGCQHFETSTKKIAAACASATSSIQIATLYKDKLTEQQTERVKQAIAVVQPVCGNRDVVPTLDTAKQAALSAAVSQLFQIATEVQK